MYSTYLSIYLFMNISVDQCIYLSMHLSIFLLSLGLFINLFVNLIFNLSVYLFTLISSINLRIAFSLFQLPTMPLATKHAVPMLNTISVIFPMSVSF